MDIEILALLLPAFVFANVPFLTQRLFFVIRLSQKNFLWELLELFVYLCVMGVLAYVLEGLSAPVHTQKWPFYVTAVSLFLLFSFPGFVVRYFWRKRH